MLNRRYIWKGIREILPLINSKVGECVCLLFFIRYSFSSFKTDMIFFDEGRRDIQILIVLLYVKGCYSEFVFMYQNIKFVYPLFVALNFSNVLTTPCISLFYVYTILLEARGHFFL